MSSQIYWVGGGKGGVGKSMVSMALLDCLVARGVSTMLIESDTRRSSLPSSVWQDPALKTPVARPQRGLSRRD
jgi:CO dehydrogenase nickel-insertion accessory protein CooC1